MDFHIYGIKGKPTLLLLPGLGVSHEIFLPLIERLQEQFNIIAAGVDGFLIGKPSHFTSVDDQAAHMEVFDGMNHGQLLVDHPDKVAQRIIKLGNIRA